MKESTVLKELTESKQQILLLSKELDELRRQYSRFVEQTNADNARRWGQEMGAVKNVVMELGDSLAVFDKLLLSKGIYSEEEFREAIISNFLHKNSFEETNKETLEKDDLAFIKFQCRDDAGNVLFEEKHFTKYQIGIGVLPFESKISTVKPGEKVSFQVEFPATFFNKVVAGRTVNVTYESCTWASRKKLAVVPAPQEAHAPAPATKQQSDRPMTINDEGELA